MKIAKYNPQVDALISACANEVVESLRVKGVLRDKVIAEYKARAKATLSEVGIEYYNGIEKLALGSGNLSGAISGSVPKGSPYAKSYSKGNFINASGINAQTSYSLETALNESDFETYNTNGKTYGQTKLDEILKADPLMGMLSDMARKAVSYSGLGWYRRNQYFKKFPEERERYEREKNPQKYEKNRLKNERKKELAERKKAEVQARKTAKAESEKAKQDFEKRQKELEQHKKKTYSALRAHVQKLEKDKKTHPNKKERRALAERYDSLYNVVALQERENAEFTALEKEMHKAEVEYLKTKAIADAGLLKEGSKEAIKHAQAEAKYFESKQALEERKNMFIADLILASKPREMFGSYDSDAVRRAMIRVEQIKNLDFSYFVLDSVEEMKELSQYPQEMEGSEDVVDDLKIIAESHLEECGIPTKIEFFGRIKENVLFTHGLDHSEIDPKVQKMILKREQELRDRDARLKRKNGGEVEPEKERVDLSSSLKRGGQPTATVAQESEKTPELKSVIKDEEIGDNH